MIAILCKRDGLPNRTLAIMDENEDHLATFTTLEEAQDFACEHILCQNSECIFIDLANNEIVS